MKQAWLERRESTINKGEKMAGISGNFGVLVALLACSVAHAEGPSPNVMHVINGFASPQAFAEGCEDVRDNRAKQINEAKKTQEEDVAKAVYDLAGTYCGDMVGAVMATAASYSGQAIGYDGPPACMANSQASIAGVIDKFIDMEASMRGKADAPQWNTPQMLLYIILRMSPCPATP